MRILFSGYHNPRFSTVTEYLEEAIRALGHDLVIFDDRQHIMPGRIRYRVPWLHRLDLNHLNGRLVAMASRTKPDIAVITGGHRILPGTIDVLNQKGIRTVLWTIDPPTHFQPIIDAATHYRHIVCQGTEAIELLDKAGIKGARWIPMACDPEHHHPITLTDADHKQYAHDIVFSGSFYPLRAALFERLAAFDFAIWGPGWDQLTPNSPLRTRIKGKHTPPSEWLKIYGAAKIVLATHYQDPENRFPVYQASPRVFEVLACRAFLITDNQRDIHALFKDGEHLVCFHDAEDLTSKIRHYLDHADERNTIAEQGRAEVLSRHTYIHRIKELISIVGS